MTSRKTASFYNFSPFPSASSMLSDPNGHNEPGYGTVLGVMATPQLLKVVFLLRPTTPALFFLYD
jgi:hypothetical protein